jgi:hypothetical protein
MAVVNFTQAEPRLSGHNSYDVVITTWAHLLNGDSGQPLSMPHYPDTTIQFLGVPGGGTPGIRWEGSLVGGADANWFTLHDNANTPVNLAAPDGRFVSECCLFLRPRVTGGDVTTDWTAILLCRRH